MQIHRYTQSHAVEIEEKKLLFNQCVQIKSIIQTENFLYLSASALIIRDYKNAVQGLNKVMCLLSLAPLGLQRSQSS